MVALVGMSNISDPYDCLVLRYKLSYQLLYLIPLHHFCERCLNHPTSVSPLKNILVGCRLSAGLQSNISQNIYGLEQIAACRDPRPLSPLENKIQDVLALAIQTPETKLCTISSYLCFGIVQLLYPPV